MFVPEKQPAEVAVLDAIEIGCNLLVVLTVVYILREMEARFERHRLFSSKISSYH